MRRLALLLLTSVMTLTACNAGPAATETPTRIPLALTPRPTLPPISAQSAATLAVPTNEPLATPEPLPTTDRTVFFSDDFSDPASGWVVEKITEGSVGYQQGAYLIEVKPNQYTLWSHVGKVFDDASIVTSVSPIDPAVDTEMGVLCRYEDKNNFVYASISSDGYYGIGQVKQGDTRTLTGNGKLQSSAAIKQGNALNRLELVCDGDTFTLIVNDQVVDSVQTTSAASGDVGLLAGTFDQPNAAARFDDFMVSKPPTDLSTTTPGGKFLFRDDFSSPNSGWDVRETENGASGYQDGRYFIRVTTPKFQLWSTPRQFITGDVIVEVTAGVSSGPQENEMGVICRYQDKENYMYASVGSDGYYAIVEVKNDQSTILTNQGKLVQSDAIPVGAESYRLRLACEGDTYTLFVNGKQIDSATSDAFTGGDVGLLAGTFDQGGVEVSYDDFTAATP